MAIDNVFWGRMVADPWERGKDTMAIRALNETIRDDQRVNLSMIPIGDGLTLARKGLNLPPISSRSAQKPNKLNMLPATELSPNVGQSSGWRMFFIPEKLVYAKAGSANVFMRSSASHAQPNNGINGTTSRRTLIEKIRFNN